ncbi:hypothetical protein HAX54_032918 [Datura stramonium]|uniref:Sulfotransferase n=1 Tax=Datura stramonium TaxID=4076 RepID=A0ABS8SCW6_DATST|nr:hypothetical protein [Datura stramonium]
MNDLKEISRRSKIYAHSKFFGISFCGIILETPLKISKEDTLLNVKKIAEFLGCPFSKEEEEKGMIEEIIRTYSFEYLRARLAMKLKGQSGRLANHLTISLAKSFDEFFKEKLSDSGLTFDEIYTSSDDQVTL